MKTWERKDMDIHLKNSAILHLGLIKNGHDELEERVESLEEECRSLKGLKELVEGLQAKIEKLESMKDEEDDDLLIPKPIRCSR